MGGAARTTPQAKQSIVRFRDSATQVDTALLTRLGGSSGAKLVYVRALSAHAHVLSVTPLPGVEYAQVLARLRADPAVDYAEEDSVLRIQR
jgi:hypothetical protein